MNTEITVEHVYNCKCNFMYINMFVQICIIKRAQKKYTILNTFNKKMKESTNINC